MGPTGDGGVTVPYPEKEIKVDDDIEQNAVDSTNTQEGVITAIAPAVDAAGFHRRLGRRQIMMMTFGAGIGTGLWVGTGTALKYGMRSFKNRHY